MKEVLILLGALIIFVAPVVAIGWVIYRVVKGSGGRSNSITGD